MPLSELYRLDKGNIESTQQETNSGSADPSSIPDNDFFELVWENGQILLQGQPSKGRKVPSSNSLPSHDLPSHTPKFRDRDSETGMNPKGGRFGKADSILNDFPLSVPSEEIGDDMVTWLNYPMDDQLHQDDCSDFLTELSGVTVNELPSHTNFASVMKRSNGNQTNRDSHTGAGLEQNPLKVAIGGGGDPTTSANSQAYTLSSTQCQTSIPSFRSRPSEGISNNNCNITQNAVCADPIQIQAPSSVFPCMRMQRQDPAPSSTNAGIMNFSHFSRPAALVKANLDSMNVRASPGQSNVERMPSKDKESIGTCKHPAEPLRMNSSSGLLKDACPNSQPMVVQANEVPKLFIAKPFEEPHCGQPCDAMSREDALKIDKSPNQVIVSGAKKATPEGSKTTEPAVTSSVCSRNSVERASTDPTQNLKRKYSETEDLDYPSDDVEEDSGGVKKAAPARGGTGSKRSRAAEVHNLSERRRRDRINEKMRALQELIPNCNKVDKASMLDEAIEYLKTLQLQVQIMSMGAGMCMPQMMLPTGMQHMHPAHMPRFSPMGIGMGMGMGMGYGMGMLDMNGGSPGCPVIQMPPMQGARFPGPPISGMSSMHGMAIPNHPMFGLHGQGHPMSMPRAPLVSFSSAPLTRPTTGLNACGPGPVGTADFSQATSSKDLMQSINPQAVQNTDVNGICDQTSSQCSDTKEGFEQSSSVLNDDQAPDVDGSRAVIDRK